MLFYFLVLQFYQRMGKRTEEDDTFLRKKTEHKQNSATTTISVNGKGTFFPVKLKLQGESFG